MAWNIRKDRPPYQSSPKNLRLGPELGPKAVPDSSPETGRRNVVTYGAVPRLRRRNWVRKVAPKTVPETPV